MNDNRERKKERTRQEELQVEYLTRARRKKSGGSGNTVSAAVFLQTLCSLLHQPRQPVLFVCGTRALPLSPLLPTLVEIYNTILFLSFFHFTDRQELWTLSVYLPQRLFSDRKSSKHIISLFIVLICSTHLGTINFHACCHFTAVVKNLQKSQLS